MNKGTRLAKTSSKKNNAGDINCLILKLTVKLQPYRQCDNGERIYTQISGID
jgi:hypothetical protein